MANILLLIWHWPQLKVLFNQKPDEVNSYTIEQLGVWQFTGWIMMFMTIMARIWPAFDVFLWAIAMFLIGLAGLFFWWFKLKKNNN